MKNFGVQNKRMHILAVGINYKTAPVEIREKLSFSEAELAEAMKALKNKKASWKILLFQHVTGRKSMRSGTSFIQAGIISRNFFRNGLTSIKKNFLNICSFMKAMGLSSIYFQLPAA